MTKIFSEDQHTMVPDILVISTKIWNGLSEDNKKAIEQAAKEATQKMFTLWDIAESAEKQKAVAQGVKFAEVNKTAFKQAVEPMYLEIKNNDPTFYQLIEQIQKIQ